MNAAILVQPTAPAPSASPSRRFRPDGWRWGFVGVHGGFALALSVAAMKHRARGQVLRHVSAEFNHPLRNDFVIEVCEDVVVGDNASWLSARVTVNGFEAVVADALFAEIGSGKQLRTREELLTANRNNPLP